jgi:hypothetical protein
MPRIAASKVERDFRPAEKGSFDPVKQLAARPWAVSFVSFILTAALMRWEAAIIL